VAHETVTKGRYAELLAQTALLANGWSVAEPIAPEPFDLVARDPIHGRWHRIQVKTARRRDDRNGEIVVYAKKSNGAVYTRDDCDLIIGVVDDEVYMFPNREISEYWISPDRIESRWTKLDTTLNLPKKEEAV
jgi:PD-(D/E)XK endonuclease